MTMWWLLAGIIGVLLVFGVGIILWALTQDRRDRRPGPSKPKKLRRKGKYDDQGYDRRGYDRDGYDRNGYDRKGYTVHGRDAWGRYNRLHDVADFAHGQWSAEGFFNPRYYPVGVTKHGAQRIHERMPDGMWKNPLEVAREAYCFGKSARQVKPSSAYLVREIEEREGTGVVLIYHGYIYIFSRDNQLITVYRNERIPL